jgi:hypothetical protein
MGRIYNPKEAILRGNYLHFKMRKMEKTNYCKGKAEENTF